MIKALFLFLANNFPRAKVFDKYRYLFYKFAGLNILGKALIWGPVSVRPIGSASNIEVGEGCFINENVRFAALSNICIGQNVLIGANVSLETVSHSLEVNKAGKRSTITKPISIEDEVWIGSGAIITQGVTVGKGSVIAAGAVVTKNVKPFTVVGGIPAKHIRDIR